MLITGNPVVLLLVANSSLILVLLHITFSLHRMWSMSLE